MAFDASAEERDTRGFISMMTMRPSAGLTANCTFDPPVSTPISRSTAIEASRIRWYSLSVSVSAGATVTQSPVWTPIGSTFSIEQTMMQLSALSRTTSISYSFQPSTHSSISTSVVGRGSSPRATISLEFLAIVGDAAAGAGQGEDGPDDAGRPTTPARRGLRPWYGRWRSGAFEADLGHGVAELQPVLGLVDDLGLGADHLDAVLGQHAGSFQRHRGVQRGLAAHGGQQGVGLLPGDDLLDDLRGDRLDVGGVGQSGIGHDRGRVGVDQDDPIALGPQRLAGLDAGIVELAGLADDDRAGADDQDGA